MDKFKSSDLESELFKRFLQSPEDILPELMERYTGPVCVAAEQF